MEQKPKKREWVKNAAIIFLAVMLVLTFFSNTILNRTLPEVVTRYVEPNSIDAKVRISGTVTARENYDVIIDQTRKVVAVNVKLGQTVSTGDILFTLESGDSQELEQAKKDLENKKLSYERFLIGLSDYDYTSDNREIAQYRDDLNKAIEKRDKLPVPAAAALEAAADAVDRAQAAFDSIDQVIKEYDLSLKEAQFGVKYSSDGSDSEVPDELNEAVKSAEETVREAKANLSAALLAFGDDYDALKLLALEAVEIDKAAKSAASKPLLDSLSEEEVDFLLAVFEEIYYLKLAGYDTDTRAASNGYSIVKRVLELEGLTISVLPKNNTDRKTDAACRDRETKLVRGYSDTLRLMPYYMDPAYASDYHISDDVEPRMRTAYDRITNAKNAYSYAVKSLTEARRDRQDWKEKNPSEDAVLYNGKSHAYWEKEVDRISLQMDRASLQRDTAQLALDSANAELNALKKQQSDREDADAEVERCQKLLEDRLFALAQQQKSDGKQQQLTALDIREWQRELAELEKQVEDYSGDVATEVKAKVNGTVASLSVSAGHKAEAGVTLATIEVEDLGYTMSATVSVDQAKLLHVGDTATVSNYYWGSKTTAVLSAMQPDPKDPRSSRMLTFDLAGDVNAGDQISFSIGEKNASYDLVVPNSALRSDTNGSFVLMITAKNSPLGNRYFATRVDVEVIASDDYNTAVKGALSNMDSVITTSSGNAPVKNGDQVRLADAN